MIEFKGTISDACKEYIKDSTWKGTSAVVIFVSIPFIIAMIVLSIMNDWIFLIMSIPIALFIWGGVLKPGTKLYRKLYGKNGKIFDGELEWHIVIEDDIISSEGIQRSETKSLIDVKKVVDMGNWYKIYFYFPHKSNIFLCQKDLIVEGTIEEFEALFKDKIIRDYKK